MLKCIAFSRASTVPHIPYEGLLSYAASLAVRIVNVLQPERRTAS